MPCPIKYSRELCYKYNLTYNSAKLYELYKAYIQVTEIKDQQYK